MAELERRVSSVEAQLAHIVATPDVLATNQNRLDEALATLADAQIRTQEQFRDTDARISNLASAIGQLIQENEIESELNFFATLLGELGGFALNVVI